MRNASSILLLANAASYNSMKVLMIKRHAKARFMANMYVFPGGVLEDSDGVVGGSRTAEVSGIDGLKAFRRGALRELWEETSVAIDAKGAVTGRAAATDYSLVDSITPFAHWQTPIEEKYRYDTWFFAHSVSNDAEAVKLDMSACPNELADLKWVEPFEALEMHRNDADDSFRLPPPTYLFLDWLSKFQKTDAFMNSIACYKYDPLQSVPTVLPVYKGKGADGGTISIPSGHIHLPDGEYPARLFNESGTFLVGDKYMAKKD